MKSQTPYSLCASATLREGNHPAIMQRLDFLVELEPQRTLIDCCRNGDLSRLIP
ncbi:hypothetical protein H6H01_26860 [Nostoc calcicola FACHB-3891]|nr:hypothetical protein [Nostoc calcicola FACHB-3891]